MMLLLFIFFGTKLGIQVSSLECYSNDEDDQSLSTCHLRDLPTTRLRYCYFKPNLIIDDAERGCALRDGLDEVDDDIYIAPVFITDHGCIRCREDSGCSKLGDLDRDEVICFCRSTRCNRECDLSNCKMDKFDKIRGELYQFCYKENCSAVLKETPSQILKCLDNDGDELQRTKMCEPKDEYCYFEIEDNKTSSIERDCATKDKFGKLHEFFHNSSAYNSDYGCFVCKKSGGCKDKGNNLHEHMDENEKICYCNTNDCNNRFDFQTISTIGKSPQTDIEFESDRIPSNYRHTAGLGRETSESHMNTTAFAISTISNGNIKNISPSHRVLMILLMIVLMILLMIVF